MRRLALILLVALSVLVAAAPAQARFFGFKCTANQNLQVDPIVSPGVSTSAHLHTFYAALGVTQNSTLQSLEASTGTSCFAGIENNGSVHPMTAMQTAANTAGLWLPTMYVNGVARNPKWVTDYWANTGAARGAVLTNMPEGLQSIGADSHATGPPPMYELYWDCGDKNKTSSTPPTCPASGPGLLAHIDMPTCWDGVGLTPADVRYAGAPVPFVGGPVNYPCPTGYKTMPRLQLIVHTGLLSGAGLTFSSGPYYTLHGDYWQSWKDQAVLVSLENFLRTGVVQ